MDMGETDTSDKLENEVERGPNGFPYLEDAKLSQWESGEYHIKMVRSDGERVDANLKEGQFDALVDMVHDVVDRSRETKTDRGDA